MPSAEIAVGLSDEIVVVVVGRKLIAILDDPSAAVAPTFAFAQRRPNKQLKNRRKTETVLRSEIVLRKSELKKKKIGRWIFAVSV